MTSGVFFFGLTMALDCVVKLGGSAVTVKDELETLRVGELRRAAALISRLCQEGKRAVVVHGAGSFGHFQAKEYQVAKGRAVTEGSDGIDRMRTGLCLTRLSVTKLNLMIIEELVKAGVPAVGLSAFGIWKTAGRRVIQHNISSVHDVLAAGYVPVLHGDCVLDSNQHCCILSGDTIIEVMCEEFIPKRVVFLTDVAGIYDQPPHMPGSQLLSQVSFRADGSLALPIQTASLPHDTTGGISNKLRTAVNILLNSKGATRVFICDIDSEQVLLQGVVRKNGGTELSIEGS
ncbi:isopentenyl phosphate kinase-like isoform X1 [Callorhinchus milii]|uniref:isopentenyl phosphate kinase-like isoform X1 n=1 Tax=Callorhinchus milii TaxID=7868 RepID=UPI001C3FBAC0|nr:isopentenyl phosphate kinase-like isoform X1 [Callorhinchus milii]